MAFFYYICIVKYDTIYNMKRLNIFLMVALLAGCQTAPNADIDECVGECEQTIKYSMPNGNDLMIETSSHVIQIEALPDVKYDYYVWVGDKETTEDPDIIIQDGNAMVLVEE